VRYQAALRPDELIVSHFADPLDLNAPAGPGPAPSTSLFPSESRVTVQLAARAPGYAREGRDASVVRSAVLDKFVCSSASHAVGAGTDPLGHPPGHTATPADSFNGVCRIG
jgi:hypothetical protein